MFSNQSTPENLWQWFHSLGHSMLLTLLGASVRLCRDTLKLSIPGVSMTIKRGSDITFCSPSYFSAPAAAGGAWGPYQLLPSSTPGVLMYLGCARITGRCALPAALGDSLPLLRGQLLPSPRTKLLTELISSPQQPHSCLHQVTHSDMEVGSTLPLQALFLSAVPFTPSAGRTGLCEYKTLYRITESLGLERTSEVIKSNN